jgi:hypothetical protein
MDEAEKRATSQTDLTMGDERAAGRPNLRCPQCGRRFALPDEPPKEIACPKCGPVAFPDLSAPTRAYLMAATEAVGAPTRPGLRSSIDGRSMLELRDENERPLYQLAPARADEVAAAGGGPTIDKRGLEALLAASMQAAPGAAFLGQLAGSYTLRIAPSLWAQILAGTAKLMPAAAGGVHSGVVSIARNILIGQAAFAPVSGATLGAAAAWQMLSLIVAQKHLYDIHARLDQIERSVDELKHLLEQDLYAEIRGHADQLLVLARGWNPDDDTTTAAIVARRAEMSDVLKEARVRHERLVVRVASVEKRFLPDRRAVWFGKSMDTVAKELTADIAEVSRLLAAMRLNVLLMVTAVDLLRRHGESAAIVEGHEEYLGTTIARDDEWFAAIMGRVDHSVMGVASIFQRGVTEVAVRLRLAGQVWAGARATARLRGLLARARERLDAEPPTLLLTVGEGGKVDSVKWVEAAPV